MTIVATLNEAIALNDVIYAYTYFLRSQSTDHQHATRTAGPARKLSTTPCKLCQASP